MDGKPTAECSQFPRGYPKAFWEIGRKPLIKVEPNQEG